MVRPSHLLLLFLLLLTLPGALWAEDFPSAGAFARGRAGMAVLATDAGAVLGNPAALGLHQAGTTVDLSALGSVASADAGARSARFCLAQGLALWAAHAQTYQKTTRPRPSSGSGAKKP